MAKAPTMGRRAGTLHVRVIPDTRNFNKRLLAQLKRLEKQLPAMKVQVNDAHIQKAHVRRALQRQLSEIRNLKINVDVDAELNNVTRELDQLRERNKKFDLVPELDKVMLERIAKQTEAAIKRIEPTITPNVDDESVRAQVNSLARELNKLERDLKISVISPEHATQIRHRINEIDDELDEMAKDRTVRVDINPFTSWASARLAWLTRLRVVEIVPVVSKAALAKAATALAALSGARLSYDYMKRFSDWISEVDKKLPSLTFGTLGVTTAFSGLMGTLSGLVGIGDGLAATLPSLLLIPGLLAGAALSGVALFVALKESKDELAELGDSYTNLGEIIKEAFWGEARESIISLSNSIMPQLERSFDKTSLAIGRFTAKLMGSFETEFAGGRLEAMFDGLAASWDELAKGTDAFAGAITNLGLVAARYMPRLAAWFVRQADTFDNWLSQVATDGRLDGWIEESIDAFYALWDVMAATTGIFQGLWKAAEAAGSGGLRGFADMLLSWEEAVNGAKWQSTLEAMFRGAGEALDGFGDGLARVGDMLHALRDPIEYLMGGAGQALGDFIGDVADALSNQKVAQGMRDFIDGVTAGLDDLEPALTPLSEAFGTLAGFVGELADAVGGPLGKAFEVLAPALERVLESLEPVLPMLADELAGAIEAFAPHIDELADALAETLPDILRALAEVLPALVPVLELVSDIIVGITDLMPEEGEWGNALSKGFGDMNWVGKIGAIITAFTTGGLSLLPNFIVEIVEQARESFAGLTEMLDGFEISLQEFLGDPGVLLLDKGREVFEGLYAGASVGFETVRAFLAGIPDNVQSFFDSSADWLVTDGNAALIGFKNGVVTGFAQVAVEIQSIPGKVTAFFANAGSWLVESGRALLQGFAQGVMESVEAAGAKVSAAVGKIRGLFPNSPAKWGPFSGSGWVSFSGTAVGDEFGASMVASLDLARKRVSKSMSGIRGEFTSLTGDVSSMSPKFDVSGQFKASRAHASLVGVLGSAAPVASTGPSTSLIANFIQPEQREQFREFSAVVERALR